MEAECSTAQQLTALLEDTFREIQASRMQGVPVINDRLAVEAVDFRQHGDDWLGVLLTPWFMNLMLLPGERSEWPELAELGEVVHDFPSGRYRFSVGHEHAIGQYQSCSLFSPMFEFADQQAATETARAVLSELMNEEHRESGDINSEEIEALWRGESMAPAAPQARSDDSNSAREDDDQSPPAAQADTHAADRSAAACCDDAGSGDTTAVTPDGQTQGNTLTRRQMLRVLFAPGGKSQ